LSDTDTDEEARLLEYRKQVTAELSRRSDRVRAIEQEIASRSLVLEESQRHRSVLTGDSQRLLAQESYRASVRKVIERLKGERAEAREDLKRAQDRLEQVDADLAECAEQRSDVDAEGEAVDRTEEASGSELITGSDTDRED
jgi:chromosome segregation ATPase